MTPQQREEAKRRYETIRDAVDTRARTVAELVEIFGMKEDSMRTLLKRLKDRGDAEVLTLNRRLTFWMSPRFMRMHRAGEIVPGVELSKPTVSVTTPYGWLQPSDEMIITEKTKITRAPAPKGRFEDPAKAGKGAITEDWMARRQGVEIPTRLKGAFA